VFALAMVGGIALSVPQAGNNRPLTYAQVLEYWKAETAETLRKNITRERITQMGVAFTLDEAGEKELLRLKMAPDLINEIRKQNRTATLIIECEPGCSMVIDFEPVGTGPAKQLTRSVLSGPINVEVSAPPTHKPVKETVTVSPGEVARRVYKLEPVGGFLDLQCEPDCVATVTGPGGMQKKVSTSNTRGSLEDLPDGEYSIVVEADGHKPARSKFAVKAPSGVNASFKLVVDEWATKPATEVLELITQSVGSPELLAYAITSKNDGRMTIKGDPPGIGNRTAQVVESAIPQKLHWEMNLAGRKWTVAYDGMMARSKGDKQFACTEFAQ
jgi:hypothetical protein